MEEEKKEEKNKLSKGALPQDIRSVSSYAEICEKGRILSVKWGCGKNESLRQYLRAFINIENNEVNLEKKRFLVNIQKAFNSPE